MGRIKDLIIIRGTNHHPQDIEWTVQASHPALRPENGAAFSVLIDGEERLVIAQEVEREPAGEPRRADEISRVVRGAVAESHDLNVFAILLLRRGSLPKTASGKLQRQACRRFFTHGGPQVLAWWVAPTRHAGELPAWLAQPAGPVGRRDRRGPSAGPRIVPSPAGVEPTAEPSHRTSARPPAKELRYEPPRSPAAAETSRRRADELIGWLRGYAADRINSRLIDERRCIPPYIILDFGNRGLLGMQVPEAYGGLGLRHVDHLRVLEQLGAIDLTLALVVFIHGTNGIRPIQYYATPALREEMLPRLAQRPRARGLRPERAGGGVERRRNRQPGAAGRSRAAGDSGA